MNITEAAVAFSEIPEQTKIYYLRTEPEVLDFTGIGTGKIILSGGKQKIDIDINNNQVKSLASFLDQVFHSQEITLLCWNIKSIVSYIKHFVPQPFSLAAKIIDISVIENFLGIQKKQPENLAEAVNRAKVLATNQRWNSLYKSLLLPLMLEVLPALENVSLLDELDRIGKFAHYEIEGQTNGRLRCTKRFMRGYVPHTLGPDQKKMFKPSGEGRIFLSSDIKHCEVSVLQWLSNDDKLKEIMDSGKDLYCEIYKIITKDDCNTDNKRKIGKEIFLKVIYGIGSKGLSDELNVPVEVAKELIDRTYHGFPIATGWIVAKQNEAKLQGKLEDFFGRPRVFTPENAYLARNFVVQGVAATICLEKLSELYYAIQGLDSKLCFSIHDGYGFTSTIMAAPDTVKRINSVMREPSKLCPGLLLKVETQFGKRLDAMKVIGRK